jgi:mono/diheme cytochrome c family protein
VVPEVADPGRLSSCVGCHAGVKGVSANPSARAKAMQIFPKWERYERNVHSYAAVPDLGAAFARLEPSWIARYLRDPMDLRPRMDETMVRLGLDGAAIDAIAAWAGSYSAKPAATTAPSRANVERGAALFTQRACGSCHDFGAISMTGVLPLAPDLRWARERMSDDMIVAWIEDPQAVSATATMPKLGVTRDEAVALRDYLVLADPGGKTSTGRTATASAAAVGPMPTWDDVEARVFGRICIHCHMDPAQNEGRAGPGNAGGFGWAATGIELQTYEGVVTHREQILAAIRRRETEEARDRVAPGERPASLVRPVLPGMPLGLPALPSEDILMVERWFTAGAPR